MIDIPLELWELFTKVMPIVFSLYLTGFIVWLSWGAIKIERSYQIERMVKFVRDYLFSSILATVMIQDGMLKKLEMMLELAKSHERR
jgi:hypothetical protein